jgi:predicted nucleic acid-binding protein
LNLVDSSAWLEYFAGGPNAGFFAAPIEKTDHLLVPTLCLYEVFKRILVQRQEGAALSAIAVMQQGHVVALDAALAVDAARVSVTERIPMADSIILTTARFHGATLWTQDSDFEGMPDVRYQAKR